MALADVYELRHTGTVLGESFTLVYHVLRASGSFDASDVTYAYYDSVVDLVRTAQTEGAITTGLSAKSLGNALDFFEAAFALAGYGGFGETISPFAAASIRFVRGRTDMHHGYKRFPGIGESSVSAGAMVAAAVTAWGNVKNAILANWELDASPGVAVGNYVVVKRILDGGQYRLPANDGELVYYQPTIGIVQPYLTTQSSRKVGR